MLRPSTIRRNWGLAPPPSPGATAARPSAPTRLDGPARLLAADPAHLGYADALASRAVALYRLDRDEAVAAARLGLCRAALGFDPSRGLKFVTYATPHIRWALRDAADEARARGLGMTTRERRARDPLPPTLPLADDDPPASRELPPDVAAMLRELLALTPPDPAPGG